VLVLFILMLSCRLTVCVLWCWLLDGLLVFMVGIVCFVYFVVLLWLLVFGVVVVLVF